jgi:hypothetical protein
MQIDDTVLYEEFVAARLRAVQLTDAYREMPADDPCRPLLWDGVVSQTEDARCLLETWPGRNSDDFLAEREPRTTQGVCAQDPSK